MDPRSQDSPTAHGPASLETETDRLSASSAHDRDVTSAKPGLSITIPTTPPRPRRQMSQTERRDTVTSTDTECSNDSDDSESDPSYRRRSSRDRSVTVSPASTPITSPDVSPVDTSRAFSRSGDGGLKAGSGSLDGTGMVKKGGARSAQAWELRKVVSGAIAWLPGPSSILCLLSGTSWGALTGGSGGQLGDASEKGENPEEEEFGFWDVGAHIRSWNDQPASSEGKAEVKEKKVEVVNAAPVAVEQKPLAGRQTTGPVKPAAVLVPNASQGVTKDVGGSGRTNGQPKIALEGSAASIGGSTVFSSPAKTQLISLSQGNTNPTAQKRPAEPESPKQPTKKKKKKGKNNNQQASQSGPSQSPAEPPPKQKPSVPLPTLKSPPPLPPKPPEGQKARAEPQGTPPAKKNPPSPQKPPATPKQAQEKSQLLEENPSPNGAQAKKPAQAPVPPPAAPPPAQKPASKPPPAPGNGQGQGRDQTARKAQSGGEPPPEIAQFCGKVVLEQHQRAYLYGRVASSLFSASDGSRHPEFGPHHLVLWTDGSWNPDNGIASDKTGNSKNAGIGVVYRHYDREGHPKGWQEHGFTVSNSLHGRESHCETLAIEAALRIALDLIDSDSNPEPGCQGQPAISHVTILSDAKTNLRVVSTLDRKLPTDPFGKGAALSQDLRKRGVAVTLRWVPSHVGIEGNDRADRVAKLARLFGPDPDPASFPERGSGPEGEEEKLPREPVIIKMPLPLLETFEGLLETIQRMEGERNGNARGLMAQLKRVEMMSVADSLRRVARDEGWVIGG